MRKLRNGLLAAAGVVMLLCAGCVRLPVPQTVIKFDPESKSLAISSPKDVALTNVLVSVSGTNFTMSIGSYRSENSVEVIKQAVAAQRNQIRATLDAGGKIIAAAAGAK